MSILGRVDWDHEGMRRARLRSVECEQRWLTRLLAMGFMPSEKCELGNLGPSVENKHFIIEISGLLNENVMFTAAVRTSSGPQGVVTWESDYLDHEHFLRCLAEPDLLPTCVGIDWAGHLLECWFKST